MAAHSSFQPTFYAHLWFFFLSPYIGASFKRVGFISVSTDCWMRVENQILLPVSQGSQLGRTSREIIYFSIQVLVSTVKVVVFKERKRKVKIQKKENERACSHMRFSPRHFVCLIWKFFKREICLVVLLSATTAVATANRRRENLVSGEL